MSRDDRPFPCLPEQREIEALLRDKERLLKANHGLREEKARLGEEKARLKDGLTFQVDLTRRLWARNAILGYWNIVVAFLLSMLFLYFEGLHLWSLAAGAGGFSAACFAAGFLAGGFDRKRRRKRRRR